MKLQSVTLRNFQSHKKTTLHLHEGVNVIVGLSGAGKSAILRGINWVIRNKSEDRGFRSRWGGKTDVELKFDDGKEISRVQDTGNAYYLFDSKNNIDEEYKAFKTDIPEDIVEALNMDSLNIQSQFDPPFLLAESSGNVAKYLNEVANLTDIDKSISNIKSWVLSNSREITTIEELVIQLEKQKASFSYLEQMEKDVVALETLSFKANELESAIKELTSLDSETNRMKADLTAIGGFLKAEELLTQALTLVEEEKALLSQIQSLENLIRIVVNAQNSLEDVEEMLKAEKECVAALELIDELATVDSEIQKLQNTITNLTVQKLRIKSDEQVISQLEREYKKSFPNFCPLCGGSKWTA